MDGSVDGAAVSGRNVEDISKIFVGKPDIGLKGQNGGICCGGRPTDRYHEYAIVHLDGNSRSHIGNEWYDTVYPLLVDPSYDL